MFPVISGENIRCHLGIYPGHVSPSCVLKGVLHGSFPKSRPMQMAPSGSIARLFFTTNSSRKIRKKYICLPPHYLRVRRYYWESVKTLTAYVTVVEIFLGQFTSHRNIESILIGKNTPLMQRLARTNMTLLVSTQWAGNIVLYHPVCVSDTGTLFISHWIYYPIRDFRGDNISGRQSVS